jgi:hypothetical protein
LAIFHHKSDHMREIQCHNGVLALYDEENDEDRVIVEPVVISFVPVRGNARCICGAPLEGWGWRCVAVDDVELGCARCHRVHGNIRLGTRVHR